MGTPLQRSLAAVPVLPACCPCAWQPDDEALGPSSEVRTCCPSGCAGSLAAP